MAREPLTKDRQPAAPAPLLRPLAMANTGCTQGGRLSTIKTCAHWGRLPNGARKQAKKINGVSVCPGHPLLACVHNWLVKLTKDSIKTRRRREVGGTAHDHYPATAIRAATAIAPKPVRARAAELLTDVAATDVPDSSAAESLNKVEICGRQNFTLCLDGG